jgi:hypothetical protein
MNISCHSTRNVSYKACKPTDALQRSFMFYLKGGEAFFPMLTYVLGEPRGIGWKSTLIITFIPYR